MHAPTHGAKEAEALKELKALKTSPLPALHFLYVHRCFLHADSGVLRFLSAILRALEGLRKAGLC